MAYINIDERIINNYNSENIEIMLNGIIERELSKDESQVNTQLVNDCVDALITLDSGHNALVPLMTSDEFVRLIIGRSSINASAWKRLNKTTRVALIAAIITGSTLTANAMVASVTNYNILGEIGSAIHDKLEDWGLVSTHEIDVIAGEDDDDEETTASPTTTTKPVEATTIEYIEETTKPTTTEGHVDVWQGEDDEDDTTTTTEGHIDVWQGEDDEDETTTKPSETTTDTPVTKPSNPQEAYLTSFVANLDNFKKHYVYGEELTYDGIKLYAVYSNGSQKPVSIEDCSYTKAVDMNKTADYKLRIIYETCVIYIDITVRPDEDTRGAEVCSNDAFDYLLTENGAYVTRYKGSSTSINIDEIDGNEVAFIGPNAFENSNLEYVTAQNAKKIFQNAFKNSKSLVDCYTPNAEYVGDNAFEGCTSLKNAMFSDNAAYIGDGAYRKTAIENIKLPAGIKEVPSRICESCSSLKRVELASKPSTVGDYAFSNCTALEKVSGTENIENVGLFAFFNDELVEFDARPTIKKAGEGAFAFCQMINFGEQNELEEIGNQSFIYCTKLTKVTLANGIEAIPDSCFRGAHIEEIIIPNSVKRIENYALMSIAARELHLPNSIEFIGEYACYTPMLRNIYFASNNIKFGQAAFYNSSRVKFYCYENSTAKQYAIDNSISYQLVEEDE